MENRRFAQHLLDNKHSIGSMEDIMEILHLTSKVSMMNTLERLYICIYIYTRVYNGTNLDNQINDKCTVTYNVIFDK